MLTPAERAGLDLHNDMMYQIFAYIKPYDPSARLSDQYTNVTESIINQISDPEIVHDLCALRDEAKKKAAVPPRLFIDGMLPRRFYLSFYEPYLLKLNFYPDVDAREYEEPPDVFDQDCTDFVALYDVLITALPKFKHLRSFIIMPYSGVSYTKMDQRKIQTVYTNINFRSPGDLEALWRREAAGVSAYVALLTQMLGG